MAFQDVHRRGACSSMLSSLIAIALEKWLRSTEGTKCYCDRTWAQALCQALWTEMTTIHFCLRRGMSLLRSGQGVSGWHKCSTHAGWSDGPVHSKAAQPKPCTGGEKSDSFPQLTGALFPQHLPVQNIDQNVCFVKGFLNFRGKSLCQC